MNYFVFRNNTVELFFPKSYSFSGYDSVSDIPYEIDGYVWFYQFPIKYDAILICIEIEEYIKRLQFVLAHANPSRPFLIFTLNVYYSVPITSGIEIRDAISKYNSTLSQLEKEHANVRILDINEFTRQYPAGDVLDWKYWFISQTGMNPRLSKPFSQWYSHKLDEIALKRKKCLVLDLDNTLWGGVLGEDGVYGIKLGGDYPGKAFLLFQESILELSKSGIILAICSKNNEDDVMEVWQKHPLMVLKKDHFATWRINWQDKATNIQDIANELNIGLDSFVFIDDNPSERELIRQALPMVEVPEFPAHPYELPIFIQEIVEKYFRVYSLTSEDRRKTEQYIANRKRAQTQHSFKDFESYLVSLEIQIAIAPASDFNIHRIAQLTQKTNQFNLTTRRYTESDIRSRLQDGWKIWCISVKDRFGDDGITGAILINGDMIDSFLISCRVLGKRIEESFICTILNLLKNQGIKTIRAQYIPTTKNALVNCFYDQIGFSCIADHDGIKEYEAYLETLDLVIKEYHHVVLQQNGR